MTGVSEGHTPIGPAEASRPVHEHGSPQNAPAYGGGRKGYLEICEPQKPRETSALASSSLTPDASSFLSQRFRQKTVLEEVPHDGRHFRHKYWFRRPRPLQYRYKGKTYESGDSGRLDLHESQELSDMSRDRSRESSISRSRNSVGEASQRSTDDAEIQRERLELFIDLLFVGIISNISEHFFAQSFKPDASSGLAVLEFILLFMPIWSIWSRLQIFLNAWFMDDIVQRFTVVWVLILSLVYGNNVPYFLLTDDNRDNYLISTYLVAKVSLVILESVYAIFVPWLRKPIILSFLLTAPSTGLWVAATTTGGWTQVGLVIGGIFTDYSAVMFFLSPLGDRFLGDDIQKARDEKHVTKRYENFFIIALGEGVILLIRGSPAGRGLNFRLGNCVLALLILYALHYLYFNADQSRRFVHAVYRRWWIKILWNFIHIPLFMNLVLLSSGILYLVDYCSDCGANGSPDESAQSKRAETQASEGSEQGVSTSHETLRTATAAVCLNVALILLMELLIALLNRPLDPPRTLLINSRFIRLLPRMAAIVALATLWLGDFVDGTSVLGLVALIVWVVMSFEWHSSMERGGGLIEPKMAWKIDEEGKQ